MERTLVILKPSALQRGLVGTIIDRFENKGFIIAGLKMMWLTDELLEQHYSHLKDKPFFSRIKRSMMSAPVIVCCLEGLNAVRVIHTMAGATNAREAAPGTIRGDFSLSIQENVIHTSDSSRMAAEEISRFFGTEELYNYKPSSIAYLYADDEVGAEDH